MKEGGREEGGREEGRASSTTHLTNIPFQYNPQSKFSDYATITSARTATLLKGRHFPLFRFSR
jgi:hypothetical protein